jgi:hypothetical protein
MKGNIRDAHWNPIFHDLVMGKQVGSFFLAMFERTYS